MRLDGEPYLEKLLDAIPLMIFVVDGDVRVIDANAAALAQLGVGKELILRRRGGDVLHCLHSQDVAEGCGRGPECGDCTIRNSVKACLAGEGIERRRMRAELMADGRYKGVELLVTAKLLDAEQGWALLILEDITELTALRQIVPICSHGKQIRNDREYWQSLESYFHETAGVAFSYSICPDCLQRHYPTLAPR